jgi:ribosome assembly protein RRB1
MSKENKEDDLLKEFNDEKIEEELVENNKRKLRHLDSDEEEEEEDLADPYLDEEIEEIPINDEDDDDDDDEKDDKYIEYDKEEKNLEKIEKIILNQEEFLEKMDEEENGENDEKKKLVYIHGKYKLNEGEELEFENSAYTMLHRLQPDWPFLSFDFIKEEGIKLHEVFLFLI